MTSGLHQISLLVTLLLLSGCATGRNYSGPARPKSEVATLIRYENAWPLDTIVNGKDTNWAASWHSLSMQVLPGPVELRVGYRTFQLRSKALLCMTFDAVAGGEYVLDYWLHEDATWGTYIMEKSTNKRIAEGVVCGREQYDDNKIVGS